MTFKERTKRIEQALGRYTLIFMRWVISHLPYPLYRGLSHIFILMGQLFLKKKKKLAIKNLNIAFGKEKSEEEINGIAENCFKSFGRNMIDLIYMLDKSIMMTEKVKLIGRENLDNALEKGNGVIFVSGHIGNFILMYLSMVHYGYKTNVIMRRTKDKAFEKYISGFRDERNIQTIYDLPQRRCVTDCLKALRRNEVLFILLDQNYGTDGRVFVDFFGLEAATATGPYVFAKRTQAAILPIFMMSDMDNSKSKNAGDNHLKNKIIIKEAVELEEFEDDQKNVYNNIYKISKIIENQIREVPHEWGGWMHNRWKSRTREEQTIIDALNEKKKEFKKKKNRLFTLNKT